MTTKIQYEFEAEIWQHKLPGGWYFLSLPISISQEIRQYFKPEEEGWGRLKATAGIGKNEWKTAIWFDTKKNSYLLPLKSEVRKAEKLDAGQLVHVKLWI